jgi:hypothetical protein
MSPKTSAYVNRKGERDEATLERLDALLKDRGARIEHERTIAQKPPTVRRTVANKRYVQQAVEEEQERKKEQKRTHRARDVNQPTKNRRSRVAAGIDPIFFVSIAGGFVAVGVLAISVLAFWALWNASPAGP